MGLRLTIIDTTSGRRIERLAPYLPVRIGRNPLNDVQLDDGFVSQFHAVIEGDGQRLFLRDLGSRNGTHLRQGGAVAPHQPLDLASHGNEFAIVSLHFIVEPADIAPQISESRKRLASLGASTNANFAQTAAVGADHAVRIGRLLVDVKPQVDAYRAAFRELMRTIAARTEGLDPQGKAHLLDLLANNEPALAREPEFQAYAASFGAGAQFVSDDAVVSPAVRELAASWVPNAPLRNGAQAVAFLGKVQDTLDVFFKAFIPLRDGYRQFESKMDIRRTGKPDQVRGAAQAVEGAADPKTLASRLLDWNDTSGEGPRPIESVFADLMIHQVAILDGVMRGVKSLLKELAPPTIEQAAAKKKGGWSFGPWKLKKVWTLYKERHSDLADEERETFELIFGKQFVKAYSQLADAQTVQSASPHGFGPPQLPPHRG